MKKTVAILLAVLLMASLSVTAFAATGNMSATVSSASVAANEEVTLTFKMANCDDCGSAALVFSFDDAVFDVVSGEWLVANSMIKDFKGADKTAALSFNIGQKASINGDLFQLTLKVKENAPAGETTVSVAPTVHFSGEDIPCTGTSVKVTVKGDEPIVDPVDPSEDEDNTTSDVKAKYNATTPPEKIVVDIAWGAMEFDYNAGGEQWDAEAHKYVADPSVPAVWAVHDNSNTITLKNHSSRAVAAAFAFNADNGYSAISGDFSYNSAKLTGALTLAKPAADTDAAAYVVSFMPTGELVATHSSTTYTKIGVITITLD